jgi:hypothetical protein
VALSLYTKAAADDINVSHGTNALKIDLSKNEGWVHDYKVTLSDVASSNLIWAAQSTDVARWVVRFDLVFPGGNAWMNCQPFLGDPACNDQLNTPNAANGGKATMSWALDLIKGIPTEGPIVLRFGDNFDATEDPFVGPETLYLDNIRLVDTYAPGAKVVTTMLQSFEKATDPLGGAADFVEWGGTPRSTYTSHTKTGADDLFVTEGTNSLKVVTDPGDAWQADFTLSFTNTLLADVLKLDKPEAERPTIDQLAYYTLRYDVIYPARDDNGKPGWSSTQTFAYDGSWPSYNQNRIDNPDTQVETFSFTLDQAPSWTLNGPEGAGAPLMVFIHQGDYGDWPGGPATYYYDNFRLIYTGPSTTTTKPNITSIQVNPQGKIVLTWTGSGVVEWASKATETQWTKLTGVTSGTPIDPPAAGPAFYRILAQ